MKLTDRFRGLFQAATRSRGDKIVRNVVLEPVEDGPPFTAVVHGTREYDVCVDPQDAREAGGCECPAFIEYGPCKHMWATMVVLDELMDRVPQVGSIDILDTILSNLPASKRFETMRALGVGMGGMQASELSRQTGKKPAKKPRKRPEPKKPKPFAAGAQRLDRLLAVGFRPDAPPVEYLGQRVRRVDYFLMSPRRVLEVGECTVLAATRTKTATGTWSVPKPLEDQEFAEWRFPEEDRALLRRLDPFDAYRPMDAFREFVVPPRFAFEVVRDLARTTRLFWCDQGTVRGMKVEDGVPVGLDEEFPLSLDCQVAEIGAGGVALSLTARRDGSAVMLEERPVLIGAEHLLVGHEIVRWISDAPAGLILELLTRGSVEVPADRIEDLEALLTPPPAAVIAPAPVCQVRLQDAIDVVKHGRLVRGRLSFRYGSHEVGADDDTGSVWIDGVEWLRDVDAEREHVTRFEELGGLIHWELRRPTASVPIKDLVPRVEAMVAAGFEVFAANDRVRTVASPNLSVKTGIDWFEVETKVEIDGAPMPLPDLLRVVAGKRGFVRLGVGEVGVLGDRDLRGLARLAEFGEVDDDTIRFDKSQGFLLDAMLDARTIGEVRVDKKFAALRARGKRGVELQPRQEPSGFGATLRPYQRDGLGWFQFLHELGVGGCLADDMGLGKTVQVLALLEQQRRRRPHPGPSLVVAPKSLVFHWEREALRFAPKLGVLVFIGTGRFDAHAPAVADGFSGFDLVLTTYGSLRNDVPKFEDVEWNYVVLDEAQAIKNPRSQASKAVRLCRARHRLALSGTPIENHLGELWALFEFLNPGMLGAAKVFRNLIAEGPVAGAPSFRDTLRAAVRPFMLRRTKEQVLTELPEKTLQTIDCELPPKQRKAYDELATHFRTTLLGELDLEKVPDDMRFIVLEALLRLRQAACHPALLDETRVAENCAKLEVLLPMLEELRAEGHKALVFSQFPSFLRLLRDQLEEREFDYAYIDGSTTKREKQVDRFQDDPGCGLFLISLKAGGHGLNLTAASYVFLLDPWWNPAVEAQAVDRAHRIGQKKKVHAYRLICRDTVEERVAELQEKKRALADAVLGGGDSVLQGLTGADVAALLR